MNLPNYITIFRIFLVPLFLTLLTYYDESRPTLRVWALAVFLIAILTDALDGIIARRLHQQTKLGTFLDPLADKVLLLSGFLGITFLPSFTIKPPLWIVIIIVFRDFFLLSGLMTIFLTTTRLPISPNLLGKVTTFCQMVTIIFLLAEWPYASAVWSVTAFVTMASAISYLRRGLKLLNHYKIKNQVVT